MVIVCLMNVHTYLYMVFYIASLLYALYDIPYALFDVTVGFMNDMGVENTDTIFPLIV